MTEMFGEAWPPMSVPDLAPDDDDESLSWLLHTLKSLLLLMLSVSLLLHTLKVFVFVDVIVVIVTCIAYSKVFVLVDVIAVVVTAHPKGLCFC